VLKKQGGLDQCHLAFYKEADLATMANGTWRWKDRHSFGISAAFLRAYLDQWRMSR
jgi:hypothetical protein